MQFVGDEYFAAAGERMRQAREVHDRGRSYALSMYLGGLAVECLLRAFRWRKDRSFDGRHDLGDLLKASELLRIDESYGGGRVASGTADGRSDLRDAVIAVGVLWHNNLRYASEASARAFFRQAGRGRGIKGDALKKMSSDLIEAALIVIDRGAFLWTSKTRSPRS